MEAPPVQRRAAVHQEVVLGVSGESLAEKTERLLEQQLDLAIGLSGLVGTETAEALYNLACAYRELTKAED